MDLTLVPEPLRASVQRWWERAGADPRVMAVYDSAAFRELRDELPRVVAVSEFCAAVLLADPDALGWLTLALQSSASDVELAESARRIEAAAAAEAPAADPPGVRDALWPPSTNFRALL